MNKFQAAVKEQLPEGFITDLQLASVIEAVTAVQDKIRLDALANQPEAQ